MVANLEDSSDREQLVSRQWGELYKEVCINIRTSDEISFKLLGLVPAFAATAAGALTLLEKSGLLASASPWVVLGLAVIGFLITFGLFRWELRNIQRCAWLIDCAADLERFALAGDNHRPERIQFLGWSAQARPRLRRPQWPWGKTESEMVVYGAALLSWLVPASLAFSSIAAEYL